MKKKDPENEGIIWPPTFEKDIKEEKPLSNHESTRKEPGSDEHHEHDEELNEDRRRVWREKNPQNLPPKPNKK